MTVDSGTPADNTQWDAPPSFDELYENYRTPLFSFAYYLTRDRGEAEDLFQEAWLRIVKHLPEKVIMKSLKTWMFTIVANLHRDNLRKKRVRNLFLLHKHKETEMDPAGRSVKNLNGSHDEAYHSDLGRDINRALRQLPERQRQVFVLKEISGFKQAEICDIMGIPIGTVKSLMYRAVRRLQGELAAYHPNSMNEGVKDAM